jgi:hypothetical protein
MPLPGRSFWQSSPPMGPNENATNPAGKRKPRRRRKTPHQPRVSALSIDKAANSVFILGRPANDTAAKSVGMQRENGHAGKRSGNHLADTPLAYAKKRAGVGRCDRRRSCLHRNGYQATQPGPSPRRSRWPTRWARRGAYQFGLAGSNGWILLRGNRCDVKTGFSPDEIGKIGGGNFLRIFGEAVKREDRLTMPALMETARKQFDPMN